MQQKVHLVISEANAQTETTREKCQHDIRESYAFANDGQQEFRKYLAEYRATQRQVLAPKMAAIKTIAKF